LILCLQPLSVADPYNKTHTNVSDSFSDINLYAQMFIPGRSHLKARASSPLSGPPNGSNIGQPYSYISPFHPSPQLPGPPPPQSAAQRRPRRAQPLSPGQQPSPAKCYVTLTFGTAWGLAPVGAGAAVRGTAKGFVLTKSNNAMIEGMLKSGQRLSPADNIRLNVLMSQAGSEAFVLGPADVQSDPAFKLAMKRISSLQLPDFSTAEHLETQSLLLASLLFLAQDHPIQAADGKSISVWTLCNNAANLKKSGQTAAHPMAQAHNVLAPLPFPPPPHPAPLAHTMEGRPLQGQESVNLDEVLDHLSLPGSGSIMALVAGCMLPEVQQPYAGHRHNDEGPALVQNDNSKAPVHGEIDQWVRNNTTHSNFSAWMDHMLTNAALTGAEPAQQAAQHERDLSPVPSNLFGSSLLGSCQCDSLGSLAFNSAEGGIFDPSPLGSHGHATSEDRDYSALAHILIDETQGPQLLPLSSKQPQGSAHSLELRVQPSEERALSNGVFSPMSLGMPAAPFAPNTEMGSDNGAASSVLDSKTARAYSTGALCTNKDGTPLANTVMTTGLPHLDGNAKSSSPADRHGAISSSPAAAHPMANSSSPVRDLGSTFDDEVLSNQLAEMQVRVEALSHNTINIIPIETAARHPAALLDLQFQLLQFRSELAPIHLVFSKIMDNVQQLDTWQTYNVISLSHALNAMNLLFMDSHVEATRLFRLERCSHIQKLTRDHAAELKDTTERLNDQISSHLIRLAKVEQVNHNSNESRARESLLNKEVHLYKARIENLESQIQGLTEKLAVQQPPSCSAQAGRFYGHSIDAPVFLGTIDDKDDSPMASPTSQPIAWEAAANAIFQTVMQLANRQPTVRMVITEAAHLLNEEGLDHLSNHIQEVLDAYLGNRRKRSPSPAHLDDSNGEASKRAKASSPPS